MKNAVAIKEKTSMNTKSGSRLVPLTDLKPGSICYTVKYGFKLQVVRQDEFETEIKVLTVVKDGARTNYVRSNTELVSLLPIDIDEQISEDREEIHPTPVIRIIEAKPIAVRERKIEAKVPVKPEPKHRGRPRREATAEEIKQENSFVRPETFARRGSIIESIIDFLGTGAKSLTEIVDFMYENKTHATKNECTAFFRASFASEEKRAIAKKIKSRISKENNRYFV